MKKTFNLLLAGLLAFSLIACDEVQPEEDGKKDDETETPVGPGNGDENGNDRGIITNRQRKCTVLHRPGFSVVPPHALFGINQNRFTAAQKCTKGFYKLDHFFQQFP